MRAPPESFKPMMGAPFWTARSITLQILSALDSEREPPKTVKSWAKTYTDRPAIVPAPHTTPSPGTCVLSIPKSRLRCVTNGSSSRKEPGSSSSSTRSCAVSLPSACCLSTRSRPPPSRRFSRRASRSAMRFSSVIGVGSEDDPPLLGELAADAPEELVPVDPARGDLLARRFHHPASLLVQGPFLLGFGFQRREDGLPQRVGRLLGEELAPRQPPRGLTRDEVLLDVRQAHAFPGADVNRLPPCEYTAHRELGRRGRSPLARAAGLAPGRHRRGLRRTPPRDDAGVAGWRSARGARAARGGHQRAVAAGRL